MSLFGSKPTHLYSFAHMTLPILALGNPKKLYSDVSGSNGGHYLDQILTGLAGRMGVVRKKQDLALERVALTGECEAFIIAMPPPEFPPEAFFIAIVFWTRRRLLKREAERARYFTLELGQHPQTQTPEYHFCEWAGRSTSPKHDNYGRLREPTLSAFVSGLRELLEV